MISAVFLILHHVFAISVDGSIALDELDFIEDVGAVCVVGVFFIFVEVLVVGDVVTGLVGLLVHVDTVEVERLHLLFRTHQFTLALALHPVVVVVLARRILSLLTALPVLFGGGHAGEQGVASKRALVEI